MKKRSQDLIIILSTALVFACVGTAIVASTGIMFIKKQLETNIQGVLSEVEALTSEASDTLDYLAKNKDVVCDESYLLFLRQLIFQARYIKDIGYYSNGNVVCTTSLGILSQPINRKENSIPFENDQEIIIESPLMLFDADYSAFRMKNKHFFVVTEFREIFPKDTKIKGHELVYKTAEKTFHVLGEEGAFNTYSRFAQNESTLTDVVVERCASSLPFCMVDTSRPLNYLTYKVITLLLIVGFLSGVFGYLLICRLVASYNSTEKRILRGLKCTNFYPCFQPLVNLQTGKIVGCEVLARYKDKHGPLFPDEFIPLLPKLNVTLPFTIKIINSALKQLDENPWIPKDFKINLNIYPTDITDQNISEIMFAARKKESFNVCFEITEDATFNSPEALKNISRLRKNGFDIAIDDFGTGYANLGQLQNIEFDFLKIDRSFVLALEGNNVKSTLIPTIVSLSNQLGVTLVAEGVETEQQAALLKNLTSGLAQGWLYGKPMSANELGELIHSKRAS